MTISYHKYKDKYPDRSVNSKESSIFSYKHRSRMFKTYSSQEIIADDFKSEIAFVLQNMQRENNIRGILNRHNLRSKSVDLQMKKRYKTENLNNSFCNFDSEDFINTPIGNRYSCGQDFADTVRASQNNWTTLGNLGGIDLVQHDIQKLKDPLNKHIKSYDQKESREELKRQNEEKQLEIEAIKNENKRLKKELEEHKAKLKALENEKLEEKFEYLSYTNRAVMDMTYREKLFAASSILSDSKIFGKRQESSSVRLSFEKR